MGDTTKFDRGIMPQIFLPQSVDITHELKHSSSEGVPVYSLHFQQYDVIRLSLVFKAGTKYQSKPFLANSVLSMLSEGTTNHSAKELSELIDYYGLFLDVSIDRDYSVVTICSLTKFFPNAMELLQEIILNPIFSEEELEVFVAKRKNTLRVERQKVDYIAREEFTRTIYGESHPYGVSYHQDYYNDITRDNLVDFHKNFYLRDNLFAVVSGNFSDTEIEMIKQLCDSLPSGSFSHIAAPEPSLEPQTKHIDHASEHQSALRIGRVMFDKMHPDYIPMQVVATILGGYFGSRLIANIREDKGYTYSIFSAMINMEDSGYFVITTEVGREYLKQTIEEVFKEMARLREELVTDQELDMVKNVIVGEMLRILDGPFGVADVTIEMIQNHTSNSYIEQMVQRVKSVTPQQVQQLANKYLLSEKMSVISVG